MTLQHQAQFSLLHDSDTESCPDCTDGVIRTPVHRHRWIGGSRDGYRSHSVVMDEHLCEACRGSMRVPTDAALKRDAKAAIDADNLPRALDCLDRLKDRKDHPVRQDRYERQEEIA